MRIKKMRGIKRRIPRVIREIKKDCADILEYFASDYWHSHMPPLFSYPTFCEPHISMAKYRRLCMQTFVDQIAYLKENTPKDEHYYRVVAAIILPNIEESQLLVFRGDSYFKEFFATFDGDDNIKIDTPGMFQKKFGISVPSDLQVSGRQVADKSRRLFPNGELWFVGDLPVTYSADVILFDVPDRNGNVYKKDSFNSSELDKMVVDGKIESYEIGEKSVQIRFRTPKNLTEKT